MLSTTAPFLFFSFLVVTCSTANILISLQVKRYGVLEGMTEKGQIEFIL